MDGALLCYYAITSPQHSYFFYDDLTQEWKSSLEEDAGWGVPDDTWGNTLKYLCHREVVFQEVSPLEVLLTIGSMSKGRNKKITNTRHKA